MVLPPTALEDPDSCPDRPQVPSQSPGRPRLDILRTVGGNLTPAHTLKPHGMGLPALLAEDPQITFCGIRFRGLAWEAG